jgi:hypothetical protein
LKKLENNLGDLYFGDLHMSRNLKSTYKRGVVMIHKFFLYAPCINNKNCLMHSEIT